MGLAACSLGIASCLGKINLPVNRAPAQQLVMGSGIHQPSLVHHKNTAGILCRGHPLGHHNLRLSCQVFPQAGPEPGLGEKVQGGEAVVKDIQLRLFYKRAGNRESLFLSARKVGSALRNKGVQSFG